MRKSYCEFQTVFFLLIGVISFMDLFQGTHIIPDRTVVCKSVDGDVMEKTVYKTSDGRECFLGSGIVYSNTTLYYIINKDCLDYDPRMYDLYMYITILSFLLNMTVSKRRITEEIVDPESGDTRCIISKRKMYECTQQEHPTKIEFYFLTYRLF
jgi:hypothetical protein